MTTYKELTPQGVEAEAQVLRVLSGFKLTIGEARNRICGGQGWVSYDHCLSCKEIRGAD